jgi:hypothetical protein
MEKKMTCQYCGQIIVYDNESYVVFVNVKKDDKGKDKRTIKFAYYGCTESKIEEYHENYLEWKKTQKLA